ncbi:hypothetical protein C8A03DRAFT_29204 [Achaetomium macrosporum]|uniref:Uncharacterized protein n=1 Tax=Achaetomium macrosporum TaxID=79813 RepID=A0AAN7CIC0_9PEZI|nr:hypothetical protein C8A03DRAFT_29204 [Achaetomium macrosporum]
MPPIPVYTKSPINAAKASGVTLQTAAPADNDAAANPPAHTTSTPNNQPWPNPTPTRTIASQEPPPPQPGAVPRLPEVTGTPSLSSHASQAGTGTGTGTAPAPSPPAPTPAPIPTTQIPGVSYPPQMGVPPPAVPTSQRGVTSTATGPAAPYAGSGFSSSRLLWDAPRSGTGSGGAYQQNVSSGGDLSSGLGSGYVPPYHHQTGRGHGNDQEGVGEEGGLFSSAVKFAKAAGGKLAAVESEIWRKINGEGS